MIRRSIFAILALMGTSLFAAPASALPGGIGRGLTAALPSGGHLVDRGFVGTPVSFSNFCDSYADQCLADGGTSTMHLDAGRWAELVEVNQKVNDAIAPVPDRPGDDIWSLDVSSGDCDDYAVAKRRSLLAQGWPSASLALAAAYTRKGEAHLVLTVRTDQGDFVLDNLRNSVVSVDHTGYRWVSRQSTMHPRLWVRADRVTRDPIAPPVDLVQVASVEVSAKPAPVAAVQKVEAMAEVGETAPAMASGIVFDLTRILSGVGDEVAAVQPSDH